MAAKKTCFVILVLILALGFVMVLAGCYSSGSSSGGAFTSGGTCKTCNGKGYTETPYQKNDGTIGYIKKSCSTCFGKGRV